MSNRTTPEKSFRLWALPAFAAALCFFAKAWNAGSFQHALLGAGLLLASIFSYRHDLLDISPRGLDPKHIGWPWFAVLCTAVLVVLAAAVVAVST